MDDLESNADSVNYLITELCRSIARQNGVVQQSSVNKLKLQSFEILLKKSKRPHFHPSATSSTDDFDPQRALEIQIFAAKLNTKTKREDRQKFMEFEEQLDVINNEAYFKNDAGRGVLQLLLLLQGNVHTEEKVSAAGQPQLLVPGPFTLHGRYRHNKYYPLRPTKSLMRPQPRSFKGLQNIMTNENPYLPKFLFKGEHNKLAEIERKFAACPPLASEQNDCTFTGMAKDLWGPTMRVSVGAFQLFANYKSIADKPKNKKALKKQVKHSKRLEPMGNSLTNVETALETDAKKTFSWNWENLGCFGATYDKPFATESEVTLELLNVYSQSIGREFKAKVLAQQQFIKDVKSLIVGIQSDTFQHNDLLIFSMQDNITVEHILPLTIANYCVEFLECGTCYKRMQMMIMKQNYKLMFEGFMFKAVCSAVDEYLLTFRQYVFGQEDHNLMTFYTRIKRLMCQMCSLSYTLGIHPDINENHKPSMGSQMLGYLYREIMRLTEKDFITLLVFLLKRCCHVYFKHLQKWIYYGLLDDPCNELFIGFVDHYRQNTKYFYDKAYFVRSEAVPGFFQNFEDQILQCGKYTMLLKANKPNHALFELEYPAISVCLTFEEIQKLEATCSKYYERARELCGKPVTIRELFEKRTEQNRNFLQMVAQRSRENIVKWEDEQQAKVLLIAEKKQRRLEELTAQLQENKQRKISDRRLNVEAELKTLRDMEAQEDHHLLKDNINLRKRIEYYQELSDILQYDEDEDKPKTHRPNSRHSNSVRSRSQRTHTPASTAGTEDFESCYDDEDASSDYAECLSDEFFKRFEENEAEIQALCARKDNNNSPQLNDNVLGEVAKASATTIELITIMDKPLKPSHSDILNSNELPALPHSIMQQNREKILSGTNMEMCVKNLNTWPKTDEGEISPTLLTEAQRNKLKILTQDFGMYGYEDPQKYLPDINLNVMPSELSQMQRNRKHMMEDDVFCEFNKHPLDNRPDLNLDLTTERSRNRRKVLHSEYNILTGTKTSTTTFIVEVPTPMSTTSDATTADDTADHANDKENGNLPGQSDAPLKINVDLANDHKQREVVPLTAATLPEVTPDYALNTAGLMARQGFHFENDEKNRKIQQDQGSEVPIQNGSLQQEDACPPQDYSTPYKRCIELISSHFRCPARSPYFRLNKSKPPSVLENRRSKDPSKQLDLNSMTIITLTEFLQKSVTIPLHTHLELVTNEVMRMYLEDFGILDHLRSLRHYFFMMDGEFGAIICECIIGKLENGATPQHLLNYQMLHSILDTALGSSIKGHDKNAEHLSFMVSNAPDKFELNSPSVLNALTLSYHLDYPLNLILNPETLEQYANIFRYLIKVRRISWVLERAYQILKEAVKQHGKNILKSPQYRHVQQIRHKFYHFVHTLQNHITANALQASWKTFKDELMQVKSIEDLYRRHTIYIKRILFLCMLNRRSVEFYKTIENIFIISLKFYNNLKSREFKLRPGSEYYTHSRYDKMSSNEMELDKFIKYTIYLGNKIVRHGYQEEIGEFISLINFNEYYMRPT